VSPTPRGWAQLQRRSRARRAPGSTRVHMRRASPPPRARARAGAGGIPGRAGVCARARV